MRLQTRDASQAWPLEAAERAVPGGRHGEAPAEPGEPAARARTQRRSASPRRGGTPRGAARMSGGDGGNRTPVRRWCNRTSPGAVRSRVSQPRHLTRTRTPTGSAACMFQGPRQRRTSAVASWMTPGTGAEALPGLTDLGARSGGEGEVGASVIGTYWFAQSVNEMTARPRPASPEPTTVVETDHPLWSCQLSPANQKATGTCPHADRK